VRHKKVEAFAASEFSNINLDHGNGNELRYIRMLYKHDAAKNILLHSE